MIPKCLGSFSSVFMTHVLPDLRRMTDLMICPEAKFRTLLQSLGLLYCPAVLRLIGTLYCYPLGNWPSMGLGPESFVEWSTCLWTWSMSSHLCKEWLGLHDINVHGFHASFLHCLYRLPRALRSGLELLVFGDLSKVFIWCLYHMTGGLFYIWICGWADREHGAVKKTWFFFVSYNIRHRFTRLFVHKFKFWSWTWDSWFPTGQQGNTVLAKQAASKRKCRAALQRLICIF